MDYCYIKIFSPDLILNIYVIKLLREGICFAQVANVTVFRSTT